MLISVIRENGRLKPYSGVDADLIDGLKHGEIYAVDIKRPRNLKHHRLLWRLVHACYENQNYYSTPEHLMEALKISIGHFDQRQLKDGTTYITPRTIGFAKMDQGQFNEFYKKVFNIIITQIIPNVNKEEFEQRVFEMCGERGPLDE